MNEVKHPLLIAVVLALILLFLGCQSQPDDGAQIANPAATYCVEQGNQYMIKTAADGSQSGVCIFADGTSCDEWAYYRKECGN
jgi:putative hemolysin